MAIFSYIIKSKYTRKLLGILGLSIVLTALFSTGQYHKLHELAIRFLYTLVITAAMWLGNNGLTTLLNKKLSWTEQPVKRLAWGVVTTVMYTTLITLLIVELLNRLNNLAMSSSDYWGSLWLTGAITAGISLILHARSFLINWRQADLDRERLERAHVASQYEALRSQVNPHFLFNSLNVLTELVHQDADLAEKFIGQLSKVYRYVLENREQELVPLSDEVRFIESFLFLYKIRHAEALQVAWELEDTALQLPPMALQLLVENALKHNVLLPNRPLNLRIAQHGSTLIVENNFQPKATKEIGTGTGLEHLEKRYRYLSGQKVKIEQTGSVFRVSLPLLAPTYYAPVIN